MAFFSCPGSSIPDLGHWLTHRHFRILTQIVTFETWDPSDIWSEWRLTKRWKDKKDKNTKITKKAKLQKDKKAKTQKNKEQKENLILWGQGSFALLGCLIWDWGVLKMTSLLFLLMTEAQADRKSTNCYLHTWSYLKISLKKDLLVWMLFGVWGAGERGGDPGTRNEDLDPHTEDSIFSLLVNWWLLHLLLASSIARSSLRSHTQQDIA